MKILVIDDMPTMTDSLTLILQSKGHEARAANTMAQAEAELRGGHDFDALILDMQGGDIDRAIIAAAARQMGIAVITMSGETALRPTLAKPFTGEDLMAALHRVTS